MASYGELRIHVDVDRLKEGGTNHRVPSGPRRAASKAYREQQRSVR